RLSMRGLFRLWFPRCDPATRAGPPVRREGRFPVRSGTTGSPRFLYFERTPYGTPGPVAVLGAGGLPSPGDRVLDVRRARDRQTGDQLRHHEDDQADE